MASYEELNAWLLARCVAYATAHKHPELTNRTIWQVIDAERPRLVQIAGPFDGFHATQTSVPKTCLVRFDNNKYSVVSRAVGGPVEIQAYADHVVIRQDGVMSVSISAALAAARRSTILGITCRCSPGSPAHCVTSLLRHLFSMDRRQPISRHCATHTKFADKWHRFPRLAPRMFQEKLTPVQLRHHHNYSAPGPEFILIGSCLGQENAYKEPLLLRQTVKKFLRVPANTLIASASNVQRHVPYPATPGLYVLRGSNHYSHERIRSRLPVPPPDVRGGYGTEENWLSAGKKDINTIMGLLTSTNFSIRNGSRILELGCATGRMIRWLADLAEECEVWGVDIETRLIVWCQENLTPPFNFATVTTMPHLPFEDRYFDLIYCGSVFSHIDDLADAWLLEIRRIMRLGGRAYVTVQDKHSADLIISGKFSHPWFRRLLLSHDKKGYLRNSDYYKLSILPGSQNCQVFYDIDYLSEHWGRILKIVSVTPEAFAFQTAVLMEK